MIPDTYVDTGSGAEKRLFKMLAEIDDPDWACLHSLRLDEHEYKIQGEIDFLLLGPLCLLVLEVKGGRISRDDSGVWVFTDRWNEEHRKSEGPFKQAESAMRSTVRAIENSLGRSPFRDLTYGFATAFPDIEFDISSVEWNPDQVIDADDCIDTITLWSAINRSIDFSRSRANKTSSVAGPAELDRILKVLRPKFDAAQSLKFAASETVRVTDELTEEQYERFDVVRNNDRVVCTGGAGTGKTFLALEAARREVEAGHRVTFLCSSRAMSSWLEAQNPESSVVFTNIDDSVELDDGVCDILIADEAQDFADFEGLSEIERLLDAKLSEGRWTVFLDPNAQATVSGRFDTDALELLMESRSASANLSRNCRNTESIVSYTQLTTGADIGVATAGKGPAVRLLYYRDNSDQSRKVSRLISTLSRDGALPRDITILSDLPFERSVASDLPANIRNQITIFSPENSASFPFNGICFSSTLDFKGFENDTVVVVDIDDVNSSSEWIGKHYVSLTRPRRQLVLSIDEQCKDDLSHLIESLELVHP